MTRPISREDTEGEGQKLVRMEGDTEDRRLVVSVDVDEVATEVPGPDPDSDPEGGDNEGILCRC